MEEKDEQSQNKIKKIQTNVIINQNKHENDSINNSLNHSNTINTSNSFSEKEIQKLIELKEYCAMNIIFKRVTKLLLILLISHANITFSIWTK